MLPRQNYLDTTSYKAYNAFDYVQNPFLKDR